MSLALPATVRYPFPTLSPSFSRSGSRTTALGLYRLITLLALDLDDTRSCRRSVHFRRLLGVGCFGSPGHPGAGDVFASSAVPTPVGICLSPLEHEVVRYIPLICRYVVWFWRRWGSRSAPSSNAEAKRLARQSVACSSCRVVFVGTWGVAERARQMTDAALSHPSIVCQRRRQLCSVGIEGSVGWRDGLNEHCYACFGNVPVFSIKLTLLINGRGQHSSESSTRERRELIPTSGQHGLHISSIYIKLFAFR